MKKSNNSVLENKSESSTNDFGDEELNIFYQKLDSETKSKIDAIKIMDAKKNVLKVMSNPKIIEYYNSLSIKSKNTFDSLPIRDKYKLIKKSYEEHQKIIIEKQKNLMPKTVQDSLSKKILPHSQDESALVAQKEEILKETPDELLVEEDVLVEQPIEINKKFSNQKQFEDIIKLFYNSNSFVKNYEKTHEVEIRFGTRGIKPLNKNDFDNVIKKLKSFGFTSSIESGISTLKIQSEYLDKSSGRFKLSDIRVEIQTLDEIQKYCKSNSIKELFYSKGHLINFVNKKPLYIDGKKIYPVNFDDFNFRVSYQIEESVKSSLKNFIVLNWEKNKKTFRYLNRVRFTNDDYPIGVDISIVKSSTFDGKEPLRTYTVEESNVFNNKERIEIELELLNDKIGPATKFNTPEKILDALRKVIKFVLSGLQGTNFPISYPEQKNIMSDYMKMIHKEKFDPSKWINPSNFIGPSSLPLQIENICDLDENSNVPNIRTNYTVTEKADGERHLLFVNKEGKIFLINTNMNIIFTGALSFNKELFNSILDGELISNDKNGKFINLYACFDIYYLNKEDIRVLPFMLKDDEKDIYHSRYSKMKKFINLLNPISILNINTIERKQTSTSLKKTVENFKNADAMICPIRIESKKFYPENFKTQNIFYACDNILSKIFEDRFEYLTDGLIFTPAFLGVGSTKEGEAGPLAKITWNYSFKWKPLKDNTIDFFVVTIKKSNGEDNIKSLFVNGTNAFLSTQLTEYKSIQLCCTYSEKKHGTIYLNPCQDILDDKLPDYKEINYEDKSGNDARPLQFYPTEPFDPDAGLCNILLKVDDNGVKQMFTEENEVFGDNMIVEFSYDFSKESGWRWIPKRVRYDKTSEYLQGIKNYGNAYHVANSNWKLINNPISEEMICTGQNIPSLTVAEDVYYNKPSSKTQTEAMKNFHNLYVKKLLIKSVSIQGNTLIDYACGKGGDLSKWVASRLSFVFGIDLSSDNIENRIDGACVRYLNSKKINKHMPSVLFVNGNSAFNIKNGSAMLNDKAIQTTKAIFGSIPKDETKLGKGVIKQYGIGEDGFNISSCQFALHYFFENPDTLQEFMKNISECTKLNGYFIGTCYDGKEIFNLLKKVEIGESIQINNNNKKVWEIIKGYNLESFEDNSSSLGNRIDVYQDSINQLIPEYLVNFDYLDRVLYNYGFKLIEREEALSLGLPEGSGLFNELFLNMLNEVKKNKKKESEYGDALNMNEYEKKISFLNRYFVYKKIMNVNTEKVQIEFSEFNPSEIVVNMKKSIAAVKTAKNYVNTTKPKIRKLTKKLLLEPSTEAIDEANISLINEKSKKERKPKERKETKKTAKLLIVEDDEN